MHQAVDVRRQRQTAAVDVEGARRCRNHRLRFRRLHPPLFAAASDVVRPIVPNAWFGSHGDSVDPKEGIIARRWYVSPVRRSPREGVGSGPGRRPRTVHSRVATVPYLVMSVVVDAVTVAGCPAVDVAREAASLHRHGPVTVPHTPRRSRHPADTVVVCTDVL